MQHAPLSAIRVTRVLVLILVTSLLIGRMLANPDSYSGWSADATELPAEQPDSEDNDSEGDDYLRSPQLRSAAALPPAPQWFAARTDAANNPDHRLDIFRPPRT